VSRIAGASELTLDGERLEFDRHYVVSQPAEIRHADGTVIRIEPGGEDLSKLRAKVEQADERLRDERIRLGVASLAAAKDQLRKRELLLQTLNERRAGLAGAGDPTAECRSLAAATTELDTRIAALESQVAGHERLPELAQLEAALLTLTARVDGLRKNAVAVTEALDDAAKRERSLLDEIAKHDSSVSSFETSIRDLEARLGAPDEIATKVAQLGRDREGLERRIADADSQVAGLDVVAQKHATLVRQQVTLTESIATLEGSIRILEDDLCGERHENLDAAIELLEGKLGRARALAESAALRARGDLLFLTLCTDIMREQQERREAPFREAFDRYLRIAYGKGGQIGIEGDVGSQSVSIVDRSEAGLGAFHFETLSHGGRELVALAARLAMAEILAAERSDRVIPLVLDDSTANLDPQRLREIGFLLDSAASRGVQVILTTCDSERAPGLRGHVTLRLEEVVRTAAPRNRIEAGSASNTAFAEQDESAGPAVNESHVDRPATTDADRARFIAALESSGGSASARALRESLGWDANRFSAVRAELERLGTVDTPEGSRSIRLAPRGGA
jgi:DNA repair exonuclease SbcCD ATPase subunit